MHVNNLPLEAATREKLLKFILTLNLICLKFDTNVPLTPRVVYVTLYTERNKWHEEAAYDLWH